MAYIIPSKNIYQIDNPKVRSNIITNVTTEQTIVNTNNEFEIPQYDNKFDNIGTSDLQFSETTNRKIEGIGYSLGAEAGISSVWISSIDIARQKVYKLNIQIPRLLQHSFISNIFYEKDKNDNNEIKANIYGIVGQGKCSQTVSWTMSTILVGGNFTAEITNASLVQYDGFDSVSEPMYFDFVSEKTSIYKGTPDSEIEEKEVVAQTKIIDVSKVDFYRETEEFFELELSIMSSLVISRLGGSKLYTMAETSGTFDIDGVYEEYIPTQIEITIYGNTIGIDLSDGSINYGTSGKPFTLSRNELVQSSANTFTKLTTEHLAENVLTQYANGKETATVLCVIGEYYNEDGALVVSTKNNELPMTFSIGDIVVPMVMGADGNDYPMSRKSDGSAKQFIVVGAKKYFDGAVWQELTLQEY